MENNFQNNIQYNKAVERVEKIKGFYSHLASFIFVNIGLMALNLATSPKHLWFFWPLFGWGIGLLAHGLSVFNVFPFFGKNWEEKQIKKIIENENQKQNKFNY